MARLGLDWAWGNLTPADIRRAGYSFACRYLSHDASKNLTPAEAKRLIAGGVEIVCVWETTASRALAGRNAGAVDAREALSQAKRCGKPANRPIFFAVDFDATPAQMPVVADYLRGAASVLGHQDTGVYGGYWVVKYMAQHNACHWFWQTYAWSGGNILRRLAVAVRKPAGRHVHKTAHLYQFQNGIRVAGVSADKNRALTDDFGQWPRGKAHPARPSGLPTLRKGDRGDSVHHLQSDLRGLRYRLAADGVFGNETQAAVKRFQNRHRLKSDGVVGHATWKAIQDALHKRRRK